MTQPNERLERQAQILVILAHDTTAALTHIARELADATPWPSDTLAERVAGGTASSPQEGERAMASYEMRTLREDMRDCIDAIEQVIRSHRLLVDRALRKRLPGNPLDAPTVTPADRCSGAVDPTCTNLASEHHHPDTGSTVEGLCDACWMAACRTCKRKPRETGRTQCAGCRKSEQRGRAA